MSPVNKIRQALKDIIRQQLSNQAGVSSSKYQQATVISLNDDGTAQISVQGVLYTAGQQYPLTVGQTCIAVFGDGGQVSAVPTAPAVEQVGVNPGPFYSGGSKIRFATFENTGSGFTPTIRFQDAGSAKMYRFTPSDFGLPIPQAADVLCEFSPNGNYFCYADVTGTFNIVSLGATLAADGGVIQPNLFKLKTKTPTQIPATNFTALPGPLQTFTGIVPDNGGSFIYVLGAYAIASAPSPPNKVDFFMFFAKANATGITVLSTFFDSEITNPASGPGTITGPNIWGGGSDTGDIGRIFDFIKPRFLNQFQRAGGDATSNVLNTSLMDSNYATVLQTLLTCNELNPSSNGIQTHSSRAGRGSGFNVANISLFQNPFDDTAPQVASNQMVQQANDPDNGFPTKLYTYANPTPDMLGNNYPIYICRGKKQSLIVSGLPGQSGTPPLSRIASLSTFVRSITFDDTLFTVTLGDGVIISPDQSGDAKFNREILGNESMDVVVCTANGGSR